MKKKSKALTITAGIPTCYGGKSLVRVSKSLRQSQGIGNFEILVVADTIPISPDVKHELKKLSVNMTENSTPGSQVSKGKQMIAATKSDIFVFTQDDVRFDPQALLQMQRVFAQNSQVTMVAAKIIPEPAASFFEQVICVGLAIVSDITSMWNNGDNILSANGRCLAFRVSHLRKMNIPDNLVNTDAYLYFENARTGGVFTVAEKSIVYNPNPQTLNEQLRQTERFLYSRHELTCFFGKTINPFYRTPRVVLLKAVLRSFFTNPLLLCFYLGLSLSGYLKITFFPGDLSPMWKINLSTKNATK